MPRIAAVGGVTAQPDASKLLPTINLIMQAAQARGTDKGLGALSAAVIHKLCQAMPSSYFTCFTSTTVQILTLCQAEPAYCYAFVCMLLYVCPRDATACCCILMCVSSCC